jgi:hypothetical protein
LAKARRRYRRKTSRERAYGCWFNMLRRCDNPKHAAYERYGGRGIKVCARWYVFECFLEDMGEPSLGMMLDRINNDLGYSLDNCRWVTPAVSAQNSRTCKLTVQKVLEIRLRATGGESLGAIAQSFNVSAVSIAELLKGPIPGKTCRRARIEPCARSRVSWRSGRQQPSRQSSACTIAQRSMRPGEWSDLISSIDSLTHSTRAHTV